MMEEVMEYLRKCGTFYLATVDGNKPKVRPFGVVAIYEGKLYIQTGKKKAVSKQMAANPNIEICAMAEDGTWMRIEAAAVEDDRMEVRQYFLDENPTLKPMYAADDGNCQVWYLTNAAATIYSFTAEPKVIRF